SGRSVHLAARALGLEPPDLLVVHDELDLPAGTVRLRERGSAGGHNGVRSIIASLRSQEFLRLRVGVGRPAAGDPDDYLLAPAPPEERAAEEAAISAAADAVDAFLRAGPADVTPPTASPPGTPDRSIGSPPGTPDRSIGSPPGTPDRSIGSPPG